MKQGYVYTSLEQLILHHDFDFFPSSAGLSTFRYFESVHVGIDLIIYYFNRPLRRAFILFSLLSDMMLIFVMVTLWVAAEAVYLQPTPYDNTRTRLVVLQTWCSRACAVSIATRRKIECGTSLEIQEMDYKPAQHNGAVSQYPYKCQPDAMLYTTFEFTITHHLITHFQTSMASILEFRKLS